MIIRDIFAAGSITGARPEGVSALATELGLRWVHGLIDLGRWNPGEEWIQEVRDRGWTTETADAEVSDEDIQVQLLRALARMREAEGVVNYAPQLDVEGLADVLRVRVDRVRSALSMLEGREALVPYGYEKNVPGGNVRITARGFDLLDRLEVGSGPAPPQRSFDALISRYFDDERSLYPDAHALWRSAVEHLEGLESGQNHLATQVGYACRVAVQEFMEALIRLHATPNAPEAKAETRNRLSALLAQYESEIRSTPSALVTALFDYWRAALDLIQRQAKAAEREGEPLSIDDARRVVIHTAMVMSEIDRLLPDAPAT
jgi:hypothetical protein